jgi:hypothetical protein
VTRIQFGLASARPRGDAPFFKLFQQYFLYHKSNREKFTVWACKAR